MRASPGAPPVTEVSTDQVRYRGSWNSRERQVGIVVQRVGIRGVRVHEHQGARRHQHVPYDGRDPWSINPVERLRERHHPARVAMQVLGHSQISLTQGTYQHVMPELPQDAAERVSKALGG